MNSLEKKMVTELLILKHGYGVTGIKAEFEAEGTRLEEMLRLKDVVAKADMDLTIKIGGCEAIRDIYEAINIGVERIVAPMVETNYALKKYLMAVEKIGDKSIDYLVNIETKTGSDNFGKMLNVHNIKLLSGIVIGRVDMTGSMGLSREYIDSEDINEEIRMLLLIAKREKLQTVIGGGVCAKSLQFFRDVSHILDRYETRKVIFDCKTALEKEPEKGIKKALEFELMWLKNKQNYYNHISKEDISRIKMLEERSK